MTVSVIDLASGEGWRASDVVCTAGPRDRAYEERHDEICIALVTEGTFRYRASEGTAMLAPGAVLLGNRGTCFECGHEHGAGDRCVSFHYTPEIMEEVLAATPGARRLSFRRPHLPPSFRFAALAAAVEAARDASDPGEFGEVALGLAGMAVSAHADGRTEPAPTAGEERKVAAAVRRIEAGAEEAIGLDELAAEAGLSRYHFLRTFRRVAGMTPYQFVLRTRLNRAAVRLRTSGDAVSAIALDAGFNDLSTFNRRFRRVMGRSPTAYRALSRRG